MGNGTGETVNVMLKAGADVSDVLGAVKQIQEAFSGLKLPSNMTGNITKDLDKLKEVMTKIKNLSNKQTFSNADMKSLTKLSSQADSLFSNLSGSMDELNGKKIYLEADLTKIKEAESAVTEIKNKIQNELNNLKINIDSGDTSKSLGMDQIITDMEKGVKSSKVLSAAMQKAKQALTAGDFSKAGQIFTEIEQKAVNLKGAGAGLLEIFRQWGVINFEGSAKNITDTEQKVKLLGDAIKVVINQLNNSNGGQVFKTLNKDLDDANAKLEEVKRTAEINKNSAFKGIGNDIQQAGKATNQLTDSMKQAGQATLDAANQIKQLQQSTQYFFGLRNMINLLKRGVHQAIDTVKELDKAMTETAVVVPEWNIGDMWAKLPEYTENANKLGVSVLSMYKATTLYYQQGLRGKEVMDIASETMKMARIGGLEAADATDKMTAALRGFNMEINATSAQRVNDVYSNLAANTASNTEELGTAMQRTASIAASAGMSFEGTAAFLAQAIETTREPAENLGTAMKTIVARFTELKKNPLEIAEVEGEEVSYNKVDTALQSIGVSLKDTNGQFRDLDQVFLDISQRWNSLTQTQQRYIATQAAGSRQQSRFIAMMSNYKRTVELMDLANNSEGASQKQFEKTLESFETKVQKLQNAWNQFLMGITDNHFIKGGIDLLTGLVGGVNKLINAVSGGVGPLKSFMSLITAFVGLKVGGRLINSLIGGLGGMVDPTSSFGAGFRSGVTGRGNPTLASQIYTPIVAAIHQAADKNDVNSRSSIKTSEQLRYGAFKDARNNLLNISKNGGTTGDVLKSLQGLNGQDQNALRKAFAVTFSKAESNMLDKFTAGFLKDNAGANTIFSKAIKSVDKYWANERDAGRITTEQFFKNISDPTSIRAALQAVDKDQYKVVSEYFDGLNQKIEQGVKQRTERLDNRIDNNKNLTDEQKQRMHQMVHSEKGQTALRAKEVKTRESDVENQRIQLSTFERGLESIGAFGSSVASAGLALQSFGSILQNSTNPAAEALGTALSEFGGMISLAGRGITGITSGVTALSSALGIGVGAATALTGGLLLLGVAIAGVIAYIQHSRKKIKDDAEKITKNYQEKISQSDSNINNLKAWKEELPRLTKGVDQNGNNVNLETSDYQHYLEIVDEIAKMNPEIVKGYNAQGHAIIDNNAALNETLELEEKIRKQAVEDYTNDRAIKKLVAARNLDKKEIVESKRTGGRFYTQKGTGTYELKPQAQMRKSISDMMILLNQQVAKGLIDAKQFENVGLFTDENGNFLANDKTINAFKKNADEIVDLYNNLADKVGDKISEKDREFFNEYAQNYNEGVDSLDKLITPVYDALVGRLSQEGGYNDIAQDMLPFFNQGLKDLASNANLSSQQMISEAKKLSNEFVNLTAKGTDYDNVMDDVSKAQEKFGEDLDASAYKKTADEAVNSLEDIKSGIDSTTSYGQALTEFLDNQIAKIANFTEEGAVNVSEALNTLIDEIAAAEGALESFKKVEEGSNFSTAADSMKEIYDTIATSEKDEINKHKAGRGDQTYWAGAEALFGRDELKKKSKAQVDQMLKDMEPMLQEGEAGWKAFVDRWYAAYDAGKISEEKIKGLNLYNKGEGKGWFKNISEDVNPDVFKELADALDMSEETLTSMLNKGRQFADINFTNYKDVRKGLATSDSVIKGREGKKKTLYMKDEALNAELANAGITGIKEQEEYKSKLAKEQNIKSISEAVKINMKEFTDMGINTQKSLIQTFGDTGQYTKEEIQQYAEKYAKINKEAFDKKQFNEDFNAYTAAADPVQGEQLKTMESVDNNVASIVSLMSDEKVAEGKLTDFKGKELKKSVLGGKGADTAVQLFGQGLSLDKNGESHNLTPREYERTKKDLENSRKENSEYLKQLKIGQRAAAARGDTEQVEKYADEIKDITSVNKAIKTALNKGEIAYKDTNQRYVNELNEKGLKRSFDGRQLRNEEYDTQEEQEALHRIYAAKGQKLTQSLMKDMKTLGIDIEKAVEEGYIIDPKKYTDFAKKKVEEEQKAKNNAEKDAEEKKNKSSKETKKLADDIDKLGESANRATKNTEDTTKNLEEVGAAGTEGIKNLEKDLKNLHLSDLKQNQSQNGEGKQESKPLPMGVQKAEVKDSQVTYKVKTEDNELDKTKKKTDKVTKEVEKPHEYKVTTNTNGLKVPNSIKKAEAKDQQVNVKFKAGEMPKASDQIAYLHYRLRKQDPPKDRAAAVNYYLGKQADPKPKSVDISPNFVGTWKKTLTIERNGARGFNNTGQIPSLSGGSLAAGNKPGTGRIGPKGKGGLTLTGELGYEVAWLPRENRSMILGTNGPEMLNLPKDAVVWNHEQSKKIIKSNSIPTGSAWIGAGSAGNEVNSGVVGRNKPTQTIQQRKNNDNKNDNKKNNKTSTKHGKNVDKTEKLIAKSAKIIKKAGKITTWWENISKKVATAERLATQNQKELEKQLKRIGTTIDSAKNAVDKYAVNLQQQIIYNKEIYNKRKKQLKNLDTNKGHKISQSQVKKANKAEENLTKKKAEYEVAKKTSSKSDDKKAKKAYEKAKKQAEKQRKKASFSIEEKKVQDAQKKYDKHKTEQNKQALKKAKKELKEAKKKKNNPSVKTVTYEDTVKVKTKKNGKTKTTKQKVKTKRTVDFSKIIYQDENGNYLLDENAINKAAGGNKKAAEAIKTKARKLVDEKQNQKNEAESKILAAGEALDTLSQQLYDTFYGWENELTKIYELTQKITALESLQERTTANQELNAARMASGMQQWKNSTDDLIKKNLELFKIQTTLGVEAIKKEQELVQSSTQKVSDLLSRRETIGTKINELVDNQKLQDYIKARDEYEEASKAQIETQLRITGYTAKGVDEVVARERLEQLKRNPYIVGDSTNVITINKKAQNWKPDEEKIKQYEQIIKDFEDIKKLNDKEANLRIVLEGQKALIEDKSAIARLEALENEQEAYEVLGKYLDLNSKQLKDGTLDLNLDFNEELLEQDKESGKISEETYNSIKQIYDNLNEENEKLKSAQTSVQNRLKELYEELASLKEEYAGYAEDLLEAYEQTKQDELDKQEKLFESLNNTLKDLLEDVKKRLDQRRQQEDNIKTETDLAKKQQRLAVLRADTSGGNASAIKQLQQEIADSQQSYERSLEDQLLSRLEEQADKAAEQRERQIRLQQASLDIAHFTGENVKVIEKYLSNPQQYQSEIRKLWEGDEAEAKLGIRKALEEAKWKKLWESFTTYEKKEEFLKGAISVSEEVITSLKNQLEEFNKYCEPLVKNLEEIAKKLKGKEGTEGTDNSLITDSNELLNNYFDALKSDDVKFIQDTLAGINELIKNGDLSDNAEEQFELRASRLEKRLTELEGNKNKIEEPKTDIGQNSTIAAPTIKDEGKRKASEVLEPVVETAIKGVLSGTIGLLKKFRSHASGGMNYTTGPAWLDGTRAKPEAVLNATDTKNFIALKDVLSNAMNGVSSIQTSNVEGGPVTYDIDINVDHLNNDYDVDKVAKRVEKIITQDSSYRNVTLVRKFR